MEQASLNYTTSHSEAPRMSAARRNINYNLQQIDKLPLNSHVGFNIGYLRRYTCINLGMTNH
jgi:hypothetical protein